MSFYTKSVLKKKLRKYKSSWILCASWHKVLFKSSRNQKQNSLQYILLIWQPSTDKGFRTYKVAQLVALLLLYRSYTLKGEAMIIKGEWNCRSVVSTELWGLQLEPYLTELGMSQLIAWLDLISHHAVSDSIKFGCHIWSDIGYLFCSQFYD